MKNLLRSLLGLFIITGLISCKKNTEFSATTTGMLQDNLIAGTWKITYLYADSTNKTAEYTDYLFTFENNGHSAVANPLMSVNGSWSVSEGAPGKPVLHLAYMAVEQNPTFNVFPGNWIVESQNAYRVNMQRTNDNGTAQLNIERLK